MVILTFTLTSLLHCLIVNCIVLSGRNNAFEYGSTVLSDSTHNFRRNNLPSKP